MSYMTAEEREAIRRRLVVIRTYKTGDNRSEFSRYLGITQSRWNNIEHGYLLTLDLAHHIKHRVEGLSLGYIVEGETGRLPAKMQRDLKRIHDELFPPTSSSSKRR